jgi:hypothetical protein
MSLLPTMAFCNLWLSSFKTLVNPRANERCFPYWIRGDTASAEAALVAWGIGPKGLAVA